jgi:putative RNA 2'-phosphotransferase
MRCRHCNGNGVDPDTHHRYTCDGSYDDRRCPVCHGACEIEDDMSDRIVTISKFLAKHLRHDPQSLGLTLQPGGWVDIYDLIDGAKKKYVYLTRDLIEEVVAKNDKKRFSLDDFDRIRANQGHSVEVDLQLTPTMPPDLLYHGTIEKYIPAITAEGLKKMKRHHVHLSKDHATAIRVGSRRGKPIILKIDAKQMAADGLEFFVSENGVWLTDHVPPRYIQS